MYEFFPFLLSQKGYTLVKENFSPVCQLTFCVILSSWYLDNCVFFTLIATWLASRTGTTPILINRLKRIINRDEINIKKV